MLIPNSIDSIYCTIIESIFYKIDEIPNPNLKQRTQRGTLKYIKNDLSDTVSYGIRIRNVSKE